MSEPRWITKEQAVRMHAEQLAVFGGPAGLRDEGMLESALGRPQNKWSFGETDYDVLAAAYAFGIARNHPFVDGNKRIGHVAMEVFLINGYEIEASVDDQETIIIDVASGKVSRIELSEWISKHIGESKDPS